MKKDAVTKQDAPMTSYSMDRLGVTVELPPGLTWAYKSNYPNEVDIQISSSQLVRISKESKAPPKTHKQAVELWANYSGYPVRVLEDGKTPSGVFYRAGAFSARVGFHDSASGSQIHTDKDIARVFGLLPLDDNSYALCTVYLEFGVKGLSDSSVQRGLKICKSLAPIAR